RRRLPLVIGAAVVLLGVIGLFAGPIIIRLKHKDGSETEIQVPGHTAVTVEKDGKVVAKVPAQPVSPPLAASPFDALDPAKIPAAERFAWEPKELVAVLGEHRQRHWGHVKALAASPDGRQVASCGHDGCIRFWDASTQRRQFVVQVGGYLTALAYSSDGKRLA